MNNATPIQLTKQQHLMMQMLGAFVSVSFDQAVAEVRTAPRNAKFAEGLAQAQDLLAKTQAIMDVDADAQARAAFLDSIVALPVPQWPDAITKLALQPVPIGGAA